MRSFHFRLLLFIGGTGCFSESVFSFQKTGTGCFCSFFCCGGAGSSWGSLWGFLWISCCLQILSFFHNRTIDFFLGSIISRFQVSKNWEYIPHFPRKQEMKLFPCSYQLQNGITRQVDFISGENNSFLSPL